MFRRLAAGLTGLHPAVRRLAAAGAAAILAAGSLLTPQPAAADTAYPVTVTFKHVQFARTDDGCYGWLCMYDDARLEVYGSVTAFTSAGAVSAGGRPARNFGTWAQVGAGCSTDGVWWTSATGGPCQKQIESTDSHLDPVFTDKFSFSDVLLCSGGAYNSCATGYSKNNNVIKLQVHAGETITVSTTMKDYDWAAPTTWCAVGRRRLARSQPRSSRPARTARAPRSRWPTTATRSAPCPSAWRRPPLPRRGRAQPGHYLLAVPWLWRA